MGFNSGFKGLIFSVGNRSVVDASLHQFDLELQLRSADSGMS